MNLPVGLDTAAILALVIYILVKDVFVPLIKRANGRNHYTGNPNNLKERIARVEQCFADLATWKVQLTADLAVLNAKVDKLIVELATHCVSDHLGARKPRA